MRLLTPSPGEVMDRITILDLKITAFDKANKDSTHLEAERRALKDYLKQWEQGLIEDCVGDDELWTKKQNQIANMTSELVAVNSLLWVAEDEVRATDALALTKLAGLCKRIAGLNDLRAKTVTELSNLYGDQVPGEKIFGVSIGR